MKTKKLLITAIAILTCISSAKAQNVNIPDAIFKAALLNNASINTNMDTEIQISEANVYTGSINVSFLGILDLAGIEAFVALDSLDCSGNQIADLDVSACTSLTTLNCYYNYALTSLDVSACTSLTTLTCQSTNLTSLDVSACNSLTTLTCYENYALTSLNVS